MAFSPKKITDAKPYEIRAYATNFLNLELSGSESDAEVLAIVQRAQPGSDQIFVMSDEELPGDPMPLGHVTTEAPLNTDRIAGSTGRGDPRVVINIPSTGEENVGRADVGVGVNGVVWQLKRNTDIEVPWRVVEALGLTVQDIVRHQPGRDNEVEVIVTQAMRFPIQFPQGMPSRQEIEEWHERTDGAFCP
jgi:hypothetical protein